VLFSAARKMLQMDMGASLLPLIEQALDSSLFCMSPIVLNQQAPHKSATDTDTLWIKHKLAATDLIKRTPAVASRHMAERNRTNAQAYPSLSHRSFK